MAVLRVWCANYERYPALQRSLHDGLQEIIIFGKKLAHRT
ncbi:Uncharacterised protein [Legionella spiritensis]|nr:Uncharacterised protein [Legionella spiritensis]